MQVRSRRVARRMGVVLAAIALCGLVFASVAPANNLDRRTATTAAKKVAKRECQRTRGCVAYAARDLRKLSRHKAQGRIYMNIDRDEVPGAEAQCRRRIILKLDHFTGDINYGLGPRRCVALTP